MRLSVRVQPRARRDALVGRLADGTLQVAVTAAPEGGRANEAVVEVMAQLLGVPRRQIRVARGRASRAKQIEVQGIAEPEARLRIERSLEATG